MELFFDLELMLGHQTKIKIIEAMKRVLIVLGLMALILRGMAQNQLPDMSFYIGFSALSNSLPNPGLLGGANYYRETIPNLPGMPTYTNRLEIFFYGSPGMPEDTWILEKQEDGSLSPVAKLTNQWTPLTLTLNRKQIHSLIEGNWYEEADFGDGNYYIGNLAPQYAFAQGPKATMIFPPAMGENTVDGYTAISPNNRTVKYVFDGSHCTDPFYLPMNYLWSGWSGDYASGVPIFTSTNIMAKHVFELGTYIISLQADDIIANGQPFYFYLQVITAGQAVDSLISGIQTTPIPKYKERVLINVLSSAKTLFNHGAMVWGCFELENYKNIVRSSHFGSNLTSYLLQPAQLITDALNFATTEDK